MADLRGTRRLPFGAFLPAGCVAAGCVAGSAGVAARRIVAITLAASR